MEIKKLGRVEAAQYIGVSARTLGNYVKAGKITPVYVKGKTSDVQEFDTTDLEALKLERDSGSLNLGTSKEEVATPLVPTSIVRAEPQIPAGSGSEEVGSVAILVSSILSTFEAKMLDVPLDRKPLLTFAEAAQLTGVSEKLLRDAARVGELKAHKIGRAQRIRQADLSAWIDDQFE